MTRTNAPDRGTNIRGEEGTVTVTTAIRALGAGLAPVRLRPRAPTFAQGPTAAATMMLRIPRVIDTTVAQTAAVSVTKQTEDPPANVTIATPTSHARLLPHGLLWTMGTARTVVRV